MGNDIACGRLSEEALNANFADAHPALSSEQAALEADRCFYCYDAPCVEACPTDIDIPRFIKAIASDNVAGAARTILKSNILGGSCARVCPTEILCEQKCVHTAIEANKPVRIGALQRYATDWQMKQDVHPFQRAPETGKKIAVVGAGPAGLACAHRLATYGHDVTIFDRHDTLGGLNQYGVAAYKLADNFAQNEIDFLMKIGGISFTGNSTLGETVTLSELRDKYDGVFLGIGLAGVRRLGLEGEDTPGVMDAVEFIETLRSQVLSEVPVGRRVVVIGGGNTAIDAAVQAKRLGADEVTLVYRRGAEHMSATKVEQEWAQTNGVILKFWFVLKKINIENGKIKNIVFYNNASDKIEDYSSIEYTLPADMILKAIGQTFISGPVDKDQILLRDGRIVVDNNGRTSLPSVYAGGDCTMGKDLTVAAVRDGRNAAEALHKELSTS
ncbi:oxidoreductase [Neokomagataea thailandica NBRC 106555]|uniref:Oxidoreductase n=1 Tax=Neokomagataea thailandica NBRC 106555 TaxID=1223520 RepID=A0ABQ0QN66_9PROT|nr:oxidoreductase [Neokomagataea thailandica NBRC 106555]